MKKLRVIKIAMNAADTTDIDNVRLILIQLAEAGEIPQSVKCIEKANNKVVRKIYAKYQMKEQDKNNAVLTDVLITKFSELMGMLNTVPSGELLAAELREDKLLQRDIKKVVEFISPFIPFIGVITGGATLGKHVMQQQRNGEVKMGTNQSEPGSEQEKVECLIKKIFFISLKRYKNLMIIKDVCGIFFYSNFFFLNCHPYGCKK